MIEMNKKKLFYISNSTLPSKHANSIHVMKMSRAFSIYDLNVTLLAPDVFSAKVPLEKCFSSYGLAQTFDIKKLPYPRLIPGQFKGVAYSLFAFLYVLFNKPDFVYGRNIIACTLSAIFGFNTGIEIHSPLSKFTKVERFIFKLGLRVRPNLNVTVISAALKAICIKEGTLKVHNLFVHHDAADKIPSSTMKVDLKGAKAKVKVGYLGHLYQGRGIDIIIELARNNSQSDFHIIGGEQKDIDFWVDKGVTANIYFYGHMKTQIAEQYRKQFDVLLSPYQRVVSIAGKGDTSAYMSPLKVFEYMATCKPIICSDLPVLREVLNEENSVLVSPDNVDEWHAALNKVMSDTSYAEKIARQAFTDFQEKYTWQQRANLILTHMKNCN
jgi:glycosyltransferase involved in cell wall biosynthesis